MRIISLSTLCAAIALTAALAQNDDMPSGFSMKMEDHGNTVTDEGSKVVQPNLEGEMREIPTNQVSKLAQNSILDAAGTARTAKDALLYRTVSPSVVLVASKEGFGSGSLVSTSGDWHVVSGHTDVAVIFKPTAEGKKPTRDEIKLGRVVRYDEVADLALVRVSEIPPGTNPIRLGDSSEIAVGMDVHAIGHCTGEAWTYTKGVISQYRQAYEWKAGNDPIAHKADIIQTQTPINPGNSGGPLVSDSGGLIGVNSFKEAGEGLNFAVSVDDVRRFLARPTNRIAREHKTKGGEECALKELSRFRNTNDDATVISYDMFCTGKDNAEYVVPDKKSEAILLRLDRNGDGNVDAVIFDFKRSGKWDLSFWDEKFDGHWTLVGYHDDGSLKPARFESYAEFQKRTASR